MAAEGDYLCAIRGIVEYHSTSSLNARRKRTASQAGSPMTEVPPHSYRIRCIHARHKKLYFRSAKIRLGCLRPMLSASVLAAWASPRSIHLLHCEPRPSTLQESRRISPEELTKILNEEVGTAGTADQNEKVVLFIRIFRAPDSCLAFSGAYECHETDETFFMTSAWPSRPPGTANNEGLLGSFGQAAAFR